MARQAARAAIVLRRMPAAKGSTRSVIRNDIEKLQPPHVSRSAFKIVNGMMTRSWHWLSRSGDVMRAALTTTAAFTRYTIGRFVADGCLTGAGALSYTMLVALVPVTAIAIAVLSAFPVFAEMRDQLLATVFRAFVPEVGVEVEWWLRYFAGTSVRTTAIGIVALAITVVLLLATIEDQLHNIWRVKSPRPWLQRILAYWAVLTLGPVLLAVSFSLPSYLDLLAAHTGFDSQALGRAPTFQTLLRFLPVALETLTFTLVYALIPN